MFPSICLYFLFQIHNFKLILILLQNDPLMSDLISISDEWGFFLICYMKWLYSMSHYLNALAIKCPIHLQMAQKPRVREGEMQY